MIKVKSDDEIKIMAEGGEKLARVKNALSDAIKVGVKASEIEELAVSLIKRQAPVLFKNVFFISNHRSLQSVRFKKIFVC